jgi:acyl-CoA thioesterase FadM
MNLWLRLIGYLLTARGRPAISLPGEISVLRLRAWLSDLDLSLHMNNGRYLSLMDLGRLDLMVGAGLWPVVVRNRWTPIANNVLIAYRREIRLLQRFRLETRLVTWDATTVGIEQRFVLEGGPRDGEVAARALFKGGIYDRRARRFVTIARMMREIGAEAVPPEPTPEVAAFLAADGELRAVSPRLRRG